MSIATRLLTASIPTGTGRRDPQDQAVAYGQHTTIDADDTIVTGLARVEQVVVQLESDPVLLCDRATGVIGNQAGSPVAGSIQIKTWQPTDVTLTTPIAATSFGKLVNWVAFGTF